MKHIVIEADAIRQPYVGVGEVCMQLCRRIAARAPQLRDEHGIRLTFVVPRKQRGVFGNHVGYISIPHALKFLTWLYPRRIDLFHMTHQFCTFKHFPTARQNFMTVHDINFMYEKEGSKRNRYARRFARKLARLQRISYISHFTRQDVETRFPQAQRLPARVIYNGVTKRDETDDVSISQHLVERLPQKPYIFHISSLLPKKNVHLLVEMMQYLRDEQLVIAGNWNSPYGQQMRQRIGQLGLTNVTCLDNVSAGEKAFLYHHCRAFAFPSLCEGFGLPPIEAMSFGKPVFLSRLTSLPEIGGEWAYYWDELDPKRMADVYLHCMEDFDASPSRAAAIIESTNRFDWDRCADEYIDYYLDALS